MPLVAAKFRFKWSAKSLRYRDTTTGRFASPKAIKADILRVEKRAAAEMVKLSEQLANQQITVSQWQERFAQQLKNLHTSGAMAGAGGMRHMTQADYGKLGQELRFQYGRLNRFARQIADRKVTRGQLMARTRMYVASIHKTYEGVRRGRAISGGVFTKEWNILSKSYHDRHCEECKAQTRLGKVPIGTLIPPGQRTCMSHCKCRVGFGK